MISSQKKINHLLWRAGFGPSLSQVKNFHSTEQVVNSLFNDRRSFKGISIISRPDLSREGMLNISKDERKKMRQNSRAEVRTVNIEWVQQLFRDENALREKMAIFWHGHLACRPEAGYYAQDYVNILRKNALGNFRNLLFAVAKSPAMMMYLDTMKNRKGSPNENFARELMELFTLGKGNYTEEDIKNAARAFTGWAIIPPDEFIVRMNHHDGGEKKVFGKRGSFTGDDVINMILERKETAHYVVIKIYKFFVNDDVNEDHVNELSESFYRSDYDIEKLMRDILTAEWFYEEKNIGTKIKSPLEIIAGITRAFSISYSDPALLQFPQRMMGQELLHPPNVAGWPGGKSWIDSSSLMFRLNLGNLMLSQNANEMNPKSDPEEMSPMESRGQIKNLKAVPNWNEYIALFADLQFENLFEAISQFHIQPASTGKDQQIIESFTNKSSREEFIRTLTLRLLSTPEYQMC